MKACRYRRRHAGRPDHSGWGVRCSTTSEGVEFMGTGSGQHAPGVTPWTPQPHRHRQGTYPSLRTWPPTVRWAPAPPEHVSGLLQARTVSRRPRRPRILARDEIWSECDRAPLTMHLKHRCAAPQESSAFLLQSFVIYVTEAGNVLDPLVAHRRVRRPQSAARPSAGLRIRPGPSPAPGPSRLPSSRLRAVRGEAR